jgi:hypothetical protein
MTPTRICFRDDTLGELRGAAIGMGMDRDEVARMSRGKLEASIQALHAQACRREAQQAHEAAQRRERRTA